MKAIIFCLKMFTLPLRYFFWYFGVAGNVIALLVFCLIYPEYFSKLGGMIKEILALRSIIIHGKL